MNFKGIFVVLLILATYVNAGNWIKKSKEKPEKSEETDIFSKENNAEDEILKQQSVKEEIFDVNSNQTVQKLAAQLEILKQQLKELETKALANDNQDNSAIDRSNQDRNQQEELQNPEEENTQKQKKMAAQETLIKCCEKLKIIIQKFEEFTANQNIMNEEAQKTLNDLKLSNLNEIEKMNAELSEKKVAFANIVSKEENYDAEIATLQRTNKELESKVDEQTCRLGIQNRKLQSFVNQFQKQKKMLENAQQSADINEKKQQEIIYHQEMIDNRKIIIENTKEYLNSLKKNCISEKDLKKKQNEFFKTEKNYQEVMDAYNILSDQLKLLQDI